ncbi:MAG: HEPN domain-containing protein [Candidatus Omnitrophota bacterium]
MSREYDDCVKRGKIKPFSRGSALAPKEIETAQTDLERARKTYEEGDYKWAIVQIYYSMFHSARALLYAKNLREHSHYCLLAAIKTLYVETKQIPARMLLKVKIGVRVIFSGKS